LGRRRRLEKFALLLLSTWVPFERTTTNKIIFVVVLATCERWAKPHVSNSSVPEMIFQGYLESKYIFRQLVAFHNLLNTSYKA